MPKNGYRRGGKQAYHGPRKAKTFAATKGSVNEATSSDEKREATRLAHSIDEAKKKVGWLVNLHSTSIEDDKVLDGRAGVDCYFIEEDGGTFKATLEYDPYFLVAVKRGHEAEAEEWLKRAPGGGVVKSLKKLEKEDLQMPNHLLGYRRTFFQLNFNNVFDLLAARRDIMPIAEKNKKNMNAMDTYAEVARYVSLFSIGMRLIETVQMLDSTFLMMTVMMIDDLMFLLPMLAISLWILGNGTFLIMCVQCLILFGG
jgi:DNA polymerase epsilon subunit 1